MFTAYLKLQIKRTFKLLPLLLLGTMLLSLMTASIAFLFSKALYNDKLTDKIKIAVVYSKSSKAETFFINALKEQDSLKDITSFYEANEISGRADLEKGKAMALIILPENFVSDIISGKNTPAKVVLNQNRRIESEIFKSLSTAGARSLSSGQAAIYSLFEFYDLKGVRYGDIEEMNKKVNEKFINLSLSRSRIFDVKTMSATGDVEKNIYYLSSLMILFLLLTGVLESFVMKPLSRGVNMMLSASSVGKFKRRFVDIIRLFILELIFVFEAVLFSYIAMNRMNENFHFTAIDGLRMFVLSFSICCFLLLIYSFNRDTTSSMLLLFFLSFIMIFLSGGFIPTAFLPESLKTIQALLPSTHWIRIFSDFLSQSESLNAIAFGFIIGLIMLIVSFAIISLRKEEE